MDVDVTNFDVVLPTFVELLATCDFISMDQEMTGISARDAFTHAGMSPSEHYGPKRVVATRYMAFQVGFCLYHRVVETTTPASSTAIQQTKPLFRASPFNFWLRQRGERNNDVVLSMPAIDFLVANHMDFQRWLSAGIHFIHGEREEEERSQLFPEFPSRKVKKDQPKGDVQHKLQLALTDEDREWVTKGVDAVKEFLSSSSVSSSSAASAAVDPAAAAQVVEREVRLGVPPSPEAALMLHHVTNRLSGVPSYLDASAALFDADDEDWLAAAPLVAGASGGEAAAVWTPSFAPFAGSNVTEQAWRAVKGRFTLSLLQRSEVAQAEAAAERKANEALLSKMQFRRLFKALVDACQRRKLPFVGHNFSADLMFFLHQHDRPLPTNYDDYKKRLHDIFPVILDTKVLSAVLPRPALTDTSLGSLYRDLCHNRHDLVSLAPGFERYHHKVMEAATKNGLDVAAAHEGGYDAFMTGCVLIEMQRRFGSVLPSSAESSSDGVVPSSDSRVEREHAQWRRRWYYCTPNPPKSQWRNHVALFGCLYYMNLEDDEEDPYANCTLLLASAEERGVTKAEILALAQQGFDHYVASVASSSSTATAPSSSSSSLAQTRLFIRNIDPSTFIVGLDPPLEDEDATAAVLQKINECRLGLAERAASSSSPPPPASPTSPYFSEESAALIHATRWMTFDNFRANKNRGKKGKKGKDLPTAAATATAAAPAAAA